MKENKEKVKYITICKIKQTSTNAFKNLTETSLSKDTSLLKFSQRSQQFFQRRKKNCGKMCHLVTTKNPSINSQNQIQK